MSLCLQTQPTLANPSLSCFFLSVTRQTPKHCVPLTKNTCPALWRYQRPSNWSWGGHGAGAHVSAFPWVEMAGIMLTAQHNSFQKSSSQIPLNFKKLDLFILDEDDKFDILAWWSCSCSFIFFCYYNCLVLKSTLINFIIFSNGNKRMPL